MRTKNHFLQSVKAVAESPDASSSIFAVWHDDNGNQTDTYTFHQMWEEAGVVAHYLRQDWGLNKGDHVVLCYNFGLHFFAAFLGCLRAGVVAVLVYPPSPPLARSLPKMRAVATNCQAKLILCDSDIMLLRDTDTINPFSKSRQLWPKDLKFQATNRLHQKGSVSSWGAWLLRSPNETSFDEPSLLDDDIAFLQYTSGSCGDPKGVMVSFGNLAANVKLLLDGVRQCHLQDPELGQFSNDQVVGCSWLPQYHDMGLVYATIAPFVGGWQQHYMSPVAFIKKPLLWLELMSRNQATMGVAPDFAYRLVVRKFVEAKKRTGGQDPIPNLDLSSIRFLSNAAEPVRPDTHELFGSTFAEYGLRPGYNHIGYGLAEHVVTICWHHGCRMSSQRGTVVAVGSNQTFHSSITVKIVNPETFEELGDGQEGEVWVSSPCVASGYHGKPDLSQEVFHAKLQGLSQQDFLRTGDLGFFEDGCLFICGRMKDVVIVNGVNYFPQDIEAAAMDASEAVRPGCVAAFSRDETCGDEFVDIVFEIRKEFEEDAPNVVASIRSAVQTKIRIVTGEVVAIKERSIPKTTSGKIRRRECRAQLHCNALAVVHKSNKTLHQRLSIGSDTSTTQDCKDEESLCDELGTEERVGHLVASILGNTDADKSWEELGLSSMASARLQNAISDEFAVDIESHAFELHKTPSALGAFVAGQQKEGAWSINLPQLSKPRSPDLSPAALACLQTIGIICHLLLFAFPIIPAYHIMSLAANANTTKDVSLPDGRFVQWFWFPLAVPVWMMGYSALIVISKWVIVGRYRAQEISVGSLAYLRWWWMDRAIHLWEFWVAQYFKGTLVLWSFYRFLGARIHPSAKLDAFVREFDLVRIEDGVSLEHQIRCRRFSPWRAEMEFPLLRFRPVQVGKGCVIKGMVGLGAVVGQRTRVSPCAVVPEGACVPEETKVLGGTPTALSENASSKQQNNWVWLGLLKLCWLCVQLYLFFGLVVVGQVLVSTRLPRDWRYTPLMNWVLTIGISLCLHMMLGIVIKWAIIGRRKPGPINESIWRDFADWAADYHFFLSVSFVMTLSSNSVVWNALLKLYGMDVDFGSKITITNFPPSTVDLVRIRNSFVSQATFETEHQGMCECTEVVASSIGYNVSVAAGTKLLNVVVPPTTSVGGEMKREDVDSRCTKTMIDVGFYGRLWPHTTMNALYLVVMGLFVAALIPAYELWMFALEPNSEFAAVPVLSMALALTTISFLVVVWVIQAAAYPPPDATGKQLPWNTPVFLVYVTICWAAQTYSLLPLLWGTPFFGMVAWLFGAKFTGKSNAFLYFGEQMYDFPFVRITERTIIDGANTNGHYSVFGETTLGVNEVSGLHHEGTLSFANSKTGKAETGPWRAVL